MNKNIFIFTDCYYPDLVSSGYFMTEIAEKLAKDHSVTVVTTLGENFSIDGFRKGVKIVELPVSNLDKKKLISRAVRFFSICFSFYSYASKNLKSDSEVLCVTNPAFFIFFIAKLKTKIGFKLTILVHDVFPEILVSAKLLSAKNPIYLFLIKLFNKAFCRADLIITCGRDMQSLFQKKLNNFNGKIEFIPNWGDIELVKPDFNLKDEKLSYFGINDKFVFQFAGNIGRAQGIPTLLQSIDYLDNKDCCFLFFGNGALVSFLQNNTPDNCIYGGSFSRKDSKSYLNACDVAIISLEKGMKGLGVPSKTYNILAAGKPILYIGEDGSEIAKVIKEHNIGFICEPNKNSITEGISWFISLDQISMESMSKRARVAAEKFYSKDVILEKYSNIYI